MGDFLVNWENFGAFGKDWRLDEFWAIGRFLVNWKIQNQNCIGNLTLEKKVGRMISQSTTNMPQDPPRVVKRLDNDAIFNHHVQNYNIVETVDPKIIDGKMQTTLPTIVICKTPRSGTLLANASRVKSIHTSSSLQTTNLKPAATTTPTAMMTWIPILLIFLPNLLNLCILHHKLGTHQRLEQSLCRDGNTQPSPPSTLDTVHHQLPAQWQQRVCLQFLGSIYWSLQVPLQGQ